VRRVGSKEKGGGGNLLRKRVSVNGELWRKKGGGNNIKRGWGKERCGGGAGEWSRE